MSANVWDQVLTKVEAKINRHSFYTWFKPTSFIADDGHALTIRVPNPLFKDWSCCRRRCAKRVGPTPC
jgi:chromosomal replication initiation ATPase DnaA